jgi:hypothetical protein
MTVSKWVIPLTRTKNEKKTIMMRRILCDREAKDHVDRSEEASPISL